MSKTKPNVCHLFLRIKCYEGRSINKLQNSAIPLILKTGKILNIRFVGQLILDIHGNYFWWWHHYCDVISSQNTTVCLCIICSVFLSQPI